PDFMVALSDDDPQVRKLAARILKAMGVTTGGEIPDAKKELSASPAKSPGEDKWAEERKMRANTGPDVKKELALPEKKPTGDDKWSDLKKMRGEESGPSTLQAGPPAGRVADGKYADLEEQIALEKKGPVTLDAAQLRSDSEGPTSVFSAVIDSLKDPDPWVRAQAARRLGMIQPAPVE